MPFAEHGDVSIYYDRAGPADAETVVFVEGLGYGRWMWRWQRERVSERYETIVVDNRGTGRSDAPPGPYTVTQFAGDLAAVLTHAGASRAHVVGASMGGMIAMEFAVDFDRVKTLTLMCTSPGGSDAVEVPEETRERMFAVPDGADEREILRYRMGVAMRDEFVEANPNLVERIIDWRLEEDASDEAREAQAAAVADFDASNQLDEIDCPVLLMHGTADRVVPFENAELLAERLPDATLVPFEGGSHLFFIERADEVTERLLKFLSEHA